MASKNTQENLDFETNKKIKELEMEKEWERIKNLKDELENKKRKNIEKELELKERELMASVLAQFMSPS